MSQRPKVTGPRPARPPDHRPAGSARGDARLQQSMAQLRAEDTYASADQCPACCAERSASGESDALCDRHMGQALGVTGGWDLGPPGTRLR